MQYGLFSSMSTCCVCVESGVARATDLPALLGGRSRPAENGKEIKIAVAAVQITNPKGFAFSNTAESYHLIKSATYLDSKLKSGSCKRIIIFHAGKKDKTHKKTLAAFCKNRSKMLLIVISTRRQNNFVLQLHFETLMRIQELGFYEQTALRLMV